MTDILIDPSNRRCRLVVVSDVAHELACEVLNLTEVKTPREITSRWILENQISTWLSQLE